MMKYRSELPYAPPVGPEHQSGAALTGFLAPGSLNQEDIMRRLDSVNQANYAVAAQKVKSDYNQAHRRAQDELALSGLQSLAEDRRSKISLQNNMLNGFLGSISPIFSSMMR